ncbi:MAG: C1 family peptidase [Bacteroidales bacterium]|nr:C1 family peptidase [Bacteroidales bacterium]MDE7071849.1 C1 family peptidase [Bacteroidales bacterium]
MKRILFESLAVAALLLCGGGLFAQALGEKELSAIKKSFVPDASTRAIQNVLTTDANIRAQALNREKQGKIDHYFKYRVDVKGITDQKRSGRCWMFTSMNVLRPGVMAKYKIEEFDFSHNYLYFYDIIEKSNLFLENIIRTAKTDADDREVVRLFTSPVDDGGVWNLYFNIASKYGVVPASVMPETEHSNNTAQMLGLVNESLRRTAMEIRGMAGKGGKTSALRERKMAGLNDVYRILALCLGEPPASFTWRYKDTDGNIRELKDYTPLRFYAEITPEGYTPDNYIMIMNDPTRAYYKVYEIQNYRNSYEGINWIYLNLPDADIKAAALASIKNNEAMYASCDVGKQFDSKQGISDPEMYDYESLLGVKLDMSKADRILSRQSGSSHAMTLVACDVDENEVPQKWEFENSWGADAGHKGYITFTDAWFSEYMFRLVIRKAYLGERALEALETKPVQLPMWDYMF